MMRKYRLSYIILFIMLFFLTACQESQNDKDLHNTSNVAEDNLTEGKLTKEKAVTLETNDQGRTTAASVTSKEILNKESNKKRNFSMMLITN